MDTQWFVTGADGFLGSTIVRALAARGDLVWAGVFGHRAPFALAGVACERLRIDVTDPDSLHRALAEVTGAPKAPARTVVIHAAGLVSIADNPSARLRAINVDGTQHVIDACRQAGIARLVYVGSMHAFPEPPLGPMVETDRFDPHLVVGGYAKTKAEASRRVLAATDLDRVLVHPTGFLGPGDPGDAPVTRLIRDLAENRMPALIPGGSDFVDVRDVAKGTIAAAERGRTGESYLLGAARLSLRDIAVLVAEETGSRVPGILPVWMAWLAAPWVARRNRDEDSRPLFTRYSLAVARRNIAVSHEKAAAELGFAPRPLADTIRDTIDWVHTHRAGVALDQTLDECA
ncbi:MAG: NAD-dependent epimerase/dehydratase family protein [Propionibacteriaceae bacterium]|nr:NAD-dependent epimerase/dehydratase family protein [Propionibacteriaceae bacterium]